ncbi:MAG: hypothetical protein WC583_00960 [Candidatus Omnitrophota bacterium]|nr:hypothetical protein [Candidatus Omnitrophota bacterium]MDD5527037.1 hypothetical protein [Candidatus Omnitrophota bacterium]
MNKADLMKRLAGLGFPLLEAAKEEEVNSTLADMVKLHDARLWEGFPVVLAGSADKGLFDYDKAEKHLKSHTDRTNLGSLVLFSLALYKTLGLKFSWADDLLALFKNVDAQKEYKRYMEALENNSDLKVDNRVMSMQRMKNTFANYFKQSREDLYDFLAVKDEMGLEYALSQVFSPKQKELFLKKLRNEKLSKTEREYFSRVVRKRVAALANQELNRLAQRLLQGN